MHKIDILKWSTAAKWKELGKFGCICMEFKFRARVYCVVRKCQEVAELVRWEITKKDGGKFRFKCFCWK